MSTIGKFFIVVNLALSAVFVGASASLIGTSQEWRSKAEAAQTELAEATAALEQEKADLTSQISQLNEAIARKDTQLTEKEADVSGLTADLDNERRQNSDMRESLTGIDSRLADLEQTNRTLNNRVTELERDNQSLREERDAALDARDEAVSAQTLAEESARGAEGAASDLRIQLAQASDRAETAETKLSMAARQYNFDLNELGIQPDLEGMVLAASYSEDPAIVQINLGKEQRVRPGFTFDVYRGNTYKGIIRIELVNASVSSATISEARPGTRIERGDRVVTRL